MTFFEKLDNQMLCFSQIFGKRDEFNTERKILEVFQIQQTNTA